VVYLPPGKATVTLPAANARQFVVQVGLFASGTPPPVKCDCVGAFRWQRSGWQHDGDTGAIGFAVNLLAT